ncbi:hypothetical protein [Altererythrobacter lutimaris]|uniref:DUF2147 domain-containing protein n=1 Tax=Altererythrobacter lutimaris TaxID=2743979 RepID=A0A850HB16_9SPHN|nr:hypothetical protein [Altererythrobacter lutimaris]NVE94096.1 hypothetical protein [Altererythrobacter lutimaris]
MRKSAIALALVTAATALPLAAKQDLGVFGNWAAFRDPETPRCYAIAKANAPVLESEKYRDYEPYASVGTWPAEGVRNQLHFRLSRQIRQNSRVTLIIGRKSWALRGGGGDAWTRDQSQDAAVLAAMRSATRMTVRGTDARGRLFTNRYSLQGAATAIDAAQLGCASR